MSDAGKRVHFDRLPQLGTGIVMAGLAALLLGWAIGADQDWFDRHFLPVFFLSRETYVLGERLFRVSVAAIGLALFIFVRPVCATIVRIPSRVFLAQVMRVSLAIFFALLTAELVMRRTFAHAAAEGPLAEEPLRQPSAVLGWTFVPSRTGHAVVGGRNIKYSIDSHGYRVFGPYAPVDFRDPSILFTGESIMAGFGLNWGETIPARVQSLTKIQSADIAVFGYANDQAYLRLKSELPRFRRPVAVVSLFVPSLFVRNLDDDRPHLNPDLSWQPGVWHSRLHALMSFFVPYHSTAAIERGIETTRAALLATAALAHARNAQALVIVPQFGPEGPVERMIRHRILDEASISYVQIPLAPDWRIKGDLHPDSRADEAIALAIVKHLER